jgi:hypothetical protein
MKSNAEAVKDQTPKTQPPAPKEPTPKANASKAERQPAARVAKEAKADADVEPADRLPTTVEELKESKSGLVTFLFLSGKDKEDIAKELKAAFKLTDGQPVKIVRRITGRARFFQRAFALMAAKERSPARHPAPREPGGLFRVHIVRETAARSAENWCEGGLLPRASQRVLPPAGLGVLATKVHFRALPPPVANSTGSAPSSTRPRC